VATVIGGMTCIMSDGHTRASMRAWYRRDIFVSMPDLLITSEVVNW
jgi:hypothetical protein